MFSNFVVLGTPMDVLDASKIAPVPVAPDVGSPLF